MTRSLRNFPVLSFAALLLIGTSLTGCGTTSGTGGTTGDGKMTTSLPTPADNADILYGENHDTLSVIAARSEREPKDTLIAARYGKALREAGNMKQAKSILVPLSDDKTSGTLVNTELSAIYLGEGNFSKAETVARKAIKQDEANYRAWRNLGNALDAQEKYKDGEAAFEKAMALWTGDDKVPVMNNLALNLAAQGYTDKALTLLYDAQKMDPNRVEIERNIRIIRTLSEPPEFAGKKYPLPESKVTE
jgi:Flp pilus assembly protein TadD